MFPVETLITLDVARMSLTNPGSWSYYNTPVPNPTYWVPRGVVEPGMFIRSVSGRLWRLESPDPTNRQWWRHFNGVLLAVHRVSLKLNEMPVGITPPPWGSPAYIYPSWFTPTEAARRLLVVEPEEFVSVPTLLM